MLCAVAGMAPAHALDAASLSARHAALREQLASNPFQRPLYLESLQAADWLKGDIYAQIEQPFGVVAAALHGMDHWCDILTLHLNVKGCRASSPQAGDTLSVSVGCKFDQPLGNAYAFELQRPAPVLCIRLRRDGPRRHARPPGNHRTQQGGLQRTGDGRPIYIAGTRGVVERHTMRYYLAIEAYLGALSVPAAQQAKKRLNAWFDGVECYPVQLHEMNAANTST